METPIEIFYENIENTSSEKIIEKIKKGEWKDILNGLCFVKENIVVLNYVYFKHFATRETYSLILNFITNNIDAILLKNNYFIVKVNMKNLTIVDIDKHKIFIQNISGYLKEKYPQRLTKCYIYNAPFVFSQFFNIVSIFIDKETQSKIVLCSPDSNICL